MAKRSARPLVAFALSVFVVVITALTPLSAVNAVTNADVTFTLVTGDNGAKNQKLVVDSVLSQCQTGAGPQATYIGYQITNPAGGTGTLTGLQVTLGAFDTANGFNLSSGQPATQYIGTLADGASVTKFWYVQYSCTRPLTDTLTLTLSDATASTATENFTVTTTSMQSANAGGSVVAYVIGAGAVLGQTITLDVTYDFGNVPSGGEVILQPSGEVTGYRADCFEVVGTQVTATSLTAVPNGATNQLYFVAAAMDNAAPNQVSVRYSLLYKCTNVVSTVLPYSAATSGGSLKYTGNYDTGICLPTGSFNCQPPAATNPFTVSKVANPTLLATGGTVTYTITITNGSAFATTVNRVTDSLPTTPGTATYGALVNGVACGTNGANEVEVTAANSSSVPTAGATGNIAWVGINAPGGVYNIPANGSLVVCYTVNLPNTNGLYTNSASGQVGIETLTPSNQNVQVGIPTATPTNTPTNTATPTLTPSDTPTSTATSTQTPSATPTFTPSATPTNTATATLTPSDTATNTPTFTETPSATPTFTPSDTATSTATLTPSDTATNTPTFTETPSATPTFTPSDTATNTATLTPSDTATFTPTFTETPSATPTFTPTDTATNTATLTPSDTATSTPSATETQTPSATASSTDTATATITLTPSPTITGTLSATPLVSETPTATSSETATSTPTGSISPSATATNTPSGPTNTPNPAATATPQITILDPAVVKLGDPSLALPGETVIWRITVTNPNAVNVDDVVVVDLVPQPFIVQNATTSQGTFSISGQIVTFTLGTIGAGQTVSMTVITRVRDDIVPPIDSTNTVTVTWAGGGTRVVSASATVFIRDSAMNLPRTGEAPAGSNPVPILLSLALIGIAGAAYMIYRHRSKGV